MTCNSLARQSVHSNSLSRFVRVAVLMVLVSTEVSELRRWARDRSAPYRWVLHARIVLAAAQDQSKDEIAEALGTRRHTLGPGCRRFALLRLVGLR